MGTLGAEYLNCAQAAPVLDDRKRKSFGKKLPAMNLDEFLQGVAAEGDDESRSSSDPDDDDKNQSSSEIKRSVEEVWREIQEGKLATAAAAAAAAEESQGDVAPQSTQGEMTLEEFLVKSGVADSEGFPDLGPGSNSGPLKRERDETGALGFMQGLDPGSHSNLTSGKRLKSFVAKLEDCCMVPISPACGGQVLSYGDGSLCLHNNEYVDKVAERRQRRMIKNRESAARSRARKQAYTAELEAEVTQLKDENDKLKNKQAEHERWRAKVVDMLTKRTKKSGARRIELRRINSI